ncbi:MAG: hypothetical protein GY696_28375, partial [Gammaproteobacteria bacterium]|nr:hypothetical protein [Gammaproteobacteria bacterium]
INTAIADSAVEQPREVTLIQDGGMSPCDAETIDVPVENQEAMIEDVVNVPDLFLESGTVDDNGMSLGNEQKSIPKVGNENVGYVVYDLARVRPRNPIVGGAQVFPIGTSVLSALLTTIFCFSLVSACFPLTEGQIVVPKFRSANQIPNYQAVSYFCPRLSGGFIPRQMSGRRSHLWCDVNHSFCNERR